jgi:hypothetical protein
MGIFSNPGEKWAKTAELNHTYYTVTDTFYGRVLEEHVFTRYSTFTLLPEGAVSLYNCHGGKVYPSRDVPQCKGLRTMRENSEWVNSGRTPDLSAAVAAAANTQPARAGRAA